jgi:hypothetical protein
MTLSRNLQFAACSDLVTCAATSSTKYYPSYSDAKVSPYSCRTFAPNYYHPPVWQLIDAYYHRLTSG